MNLLSRDLKTPINRLQDFYKSPINLLSRDYKTDRCSLQNSEPGIRNSELVYFTEFEPLTALIVQFIPGDPIRDHVTISAKMLAYQWPACFHGMHPKCKQIDCRVWRLEYQTGKSGVSVGCISCNGTSGYICLLRKTNWTIY